MARFFFSLLFAVALGHGELCAADGAALIRETDLDYRASQSRRNDALVYYNSGDFPRALSAMTDASRLRPTHSGLILNRVRLALAAGMAEAALDAATDYQNLGLPLPGGILDTLVQQSDSPLIGGLVRKNTALSRPVGRFETYATIPAEYRLVEAVVADGDGRLYATTVVSRQIIGQRDDGTWRVILDGAKAGYPSFFGLVYDGGYLTASYGVIDQTPGWTFPYKVTGLLTVNPETGKVTETFDANRATDPLEQLGDIGRIGYRVYVSDAATGGVYHKGNCQFHRVNGTHDGIQNPQGIAFLEGSPHADGRVFVADYGRGIWELFLYDPPKLMAWPGDQTLLGIDGLVAYKDALYAVQNGVQPNRVLKLSLKGDSISAVEVIAQNHEDFHEPTTLAVIDVGLLLVAQSQWPIYGKDGVVKDGTAPTETKILRLIEGE